MKIFGLRTKIIGLLIILITLVMGAMTYVSVRVQVDARLTEFTEQARAIGQVFGLNYARSLLTESAIEDRQAVSTRLWKETNERSIYLMAYGVNGAKIHKSPDTLPERYREIPDLSSSQVRRLLQSDRPYLRRWNRGLELYDVLVPIRYHGSRFGVIRLGLDTTEISETRSAIIYQNLQITGIFWAIAALVGMVATGRIVRPLESLVDITRQLGEGDLSTRGDVETSDEIGELSETFNEMADQIQQRVRERERSIEQLEAIQTVGSTLNESADPEVFFPVLDEAMQTLYDIEAFVPLIDDGDVYTAPYSRPELDSPLFLSPDSQVIENVDREAEPFRIEPEEDWPPPLQSMNWAYPLKVGYYLNGVLFMELGHEPEEQELNWMTIWGTQVAQAIRAMVLNRQVTDYRSRPVQAIRDQVETFIQSELTEFADLTLPNYAENQREEGLFYGEDFNEQIGDALESLDYSLSHLQIRPDRFLVAAEELNGFEKTELEETVREHVDFEFNMRWFEGEEEPSVEIIDQFLMDAS
jgi:HAMP domain-containing protein